MDGSLESLINLYVTTTGRLLFGIRQVRVEAHQRGFTQLVKHCDATIAHAEATRELERRWAGEPVNNGANPAAQRTDVLVDRLLGAIRDHAVAQAQGAAPGDPIHATVETFVKTIFPRGVFEVTSMPFVEELAAVDDILKLLKGKLAPTVKELGLGRLSQRLAELAEQYREALQGPPSLVGWDAVRAARADGQGMLLEAVAIILGKHHDRTPEGTEERLALLSPILKQNEAIGQYLKARRSVGDVNPDTGEDAPSAPGEVAGSEAAKPNGGKAEGDKPNGAKPEAPKPEPAKPEPAPGNG